MNEPPVRREGDGPNEADADRGVSRREFLACAACGPLLLGEAAAHAAPAAPSPVATIAPRPGELPVHLRVNGAERALSLDPRTTLLDALREQLGLFGTKKGCDHGQCGTCTVLVGERRIYSCLTLAVMHQGASVTTIEGLPKGEALHPMQTAFLAHDALQCGYCTPGQIVSAVGLLSEPCGPSDDEVREAMSGNLCRCGAYPGIVAAVQSVRPRPKETR